MRDQITGESAVLVAAIGSALVLLVGVVGARCAVQRRMTVGALQRLDELQSVVATWQVSHRVRMRLLDERMRTIERSAARAEDDARTAATSMRQIHSELLRRMEDVEHRIELETLVAQGRIPAEHIPHPYLRQWTT